MADAIDESSNVLNPNNAQDGYIAFRVHCLIIAVKNRMPFTVLSWNIKDENIA